MALSEMMKHFLSVKDRYKDCIIFYRLGDFYEMFFDDAVEASELLDLTLTGRDCGLEQRAPMCGVPYHAADGYIAKLISLGKKVAICEQLEDPATAKGMVARDVIRVVTPGTLTTDIGLNEKSNNFICCAYKKDDKIALAWADITTGALTATEYFVDSLQKCIAQMLKIEVKEVICNDEMLFAAKGCPEVARKLLPPFSSYLSQAFVYSSSERRLMEQFNVKSLASFSIFGKNAAICATGALLEYLQETQKHALKNITDITYLESEQYLQLDNVALRNLEIVKTLSDGNRYGSLLWLLDKTRTAMGARLLNSSILYPLRSKGDIDYRLDGVEELFESTVVRLSVQELLSNVKDVERIAGKISNNVISPKDCLSLSASLSVIPNIKLQLSGFNSAILNDICENLIDMHDVTELIDSAIDCKKATNNANDGNFIRDGFNAELDELHAINRNAVDLINAMESRERDATGIKNLRIHYNRVFGYYIEVTKSFKDKVPVHYQRRQTLANAERYWTEELKELEEKILTSADKAFKLEIELYNVIKEGLSQRIAQFKKIASAFALLDMISCFAETAKSNRYVRPQIVELGEPLIIKEGRHPVVEAISKEKFIQNDALIDCGENRTIILTGPNMAGKSTYMRQIAIMTIMAHMGCFVPAKSAQIPITDRIFTRVGASDNLVSDQSTFMVEMIEVATILRNATKNSLLILDEVGRGTSTYDGLSIAWAVIEHLTRNVGAKTLFATHYHELTELENKIEGVKNYKIAVKEIGGQVVFLRKIMRGGANRSYGIEVAALAGVPTEVTDRAKQILKLVEKGQSSHVEEQDEAENPRSEVEKILEETDLNSLSPMQAFMLLGDLIEKVKNEKD